MYITRRIRFSRTTYVLVTRTWRIIILPESDVLSYVVNRHRRVTQLFDKKPAIAQDVFIAPNASVMGQVKLAQGASVWYGAVLRGRHQYIVYLRKEQYKR